MRCAIIGYGKMGKVRASAIEQCGGTVECIFEKSEIKTDYKKANSVEEIFNDENLDCIFICTPNSFNKEYTIRALQSGKNVFCEKPPCFTADEVMEIRAAEVRSGKKLMYGFNHRHHESIKYMKQLIDSNEYGNILWMRGRYGKSVDDDFFKTWRASKELSGAGILMDQGIHMVDLFLHLYSDFDVVKSVVSNNYWKIHGVEDNVFAIMANSKTGVSAQLHSTMTDWRFIFSLEVFLSSGYLVLNGLKTSTGKYGKEMLTIAKNRTTAPKATFTEEINITYDVDNSWNSEVEHFFDCVKKDIPIKTGNSLDALSLMKIIDEIYLQK